MMSFNDFIHKYSLKNKATSNIKIYQVLPSIGLDNVDMYMYLRDRPFSSDVQVAKLDQSKGTHWVAYINEKLFDSYGCSPPQKLSEFIIKRNGHYLFSEYKIQGLTSTKRFLLCRLMFIYNLLEKSLRNRI